MRHLAIALISLIFSSPLVFAEQQGWQEVETAFGRKGTVQEDMLKITLPRTDLAVKVGEVAVEPGLALTSWLGFKGTGKNAMMMGDLVLLEREVAPVMSQLIAQGIEVTALHNHILNESPRVMYLHFSGNGDPAKLAETMRSSLSLTGTPMGEQQAATTQAAAIDWTKVETILAKTGQKKGNLFQVSFSRKETIKEHGMEVPSFLGMASPKHPSCRQPGRYYRRFCTACRRGQSGGEGPCQSQHNRHCHSQPHAPRVSPALLLALLGV